MTCKTKNFTFSYWPKKGSYVLFDCWVVVGGGVTASAVGLSEPEAIAFLEKYRQSLIDELSMSEGV